MSPSSSIPVPHRLPFELSHLAGLAWLAGWLAFQNKIFYSHAVWSHVYAFHAVHVDFDVFVDVVAAEVYREIAELKRKASTVGTEIAKKGGRQKNLEPQTSGESVYL